MAGAGGENPAPQGLPSFLCPGWACRRSVLSDCGLTDLLLTVLGGQAAAGDSFLRADGHVGDRGGDARSRVAAGSLPRAKRGGAHCMLMVAL